MDQNIIQKAKSAVLKAFQSISQPRQIGNGGLIQPFNQTRQMPTNLPVASAIKTNLSIPKFTPSLNPVSNFVNKTTIGKTIQSRVLEPIRQVPSSLQTIKLEAPKLISSQYTPKQKLGSLGKIGLSGLQVAGAALPLGPEDVAMAGYDVLKAKLAGKSTKKALTGEEYTGLGDINTKIPEMLRSGLNLAELPLMMVAGGLTAKKMADYSNVIKNETAINRAVHFIDNFDKMDSKSSMRNWNELLETVEKVIPDIAKNKEVRSLMSSNPQLWNKWIRDALVTRLDDAKTKNIGISLQAKPVGGMEAVKQAEISKGLTPEVKGTTSQVPNIGTGKESLLVSQQPSTPQIEVPTTNKVLSTSAQAIIPPKNATPEQVASTLPNRIDNFVNKVLGYSTEAPKGGTKEASLYTKTLRGVENKFTSGVEKAMGSENSLIRNAATNLQNLFRGSGMSPERSGASMELRGGIANANERAFNIMDSLYKSLKSDKGSLARINAVLDPSLSKTKVSLKDLSPTEKQVYGVIREGLDLVHDTSYANGHISPELYSSNKGKYVPRLYDVTELPPEVSSFLTQGKKMANDLYKSRKDITDWKIENSLNDPVYGLGKRLAQVETNKAIKGYTDFLSSNPNLVSDVERQGFTKLSDSKAYGNLSGKYVLNSAAEDLKGFFFSNQATQNLYDVFKAYDRMPIRQLQKKLLTVFNPTTNVGNIVSDQVFGFVTGVDPLTLNKNLLQFKSNPKQFKQLNDYLLRSGITGTDITRTDFVNKLGSINDLASGKKPNVVAKIANKVQSFYGGTDDVYKVSAFKALLDKGFTLEEATRKVADGFQNYANVGKFYDVWAKTPIVGSTFIKFQGDLMRIIKNGAVNNPLGLISFLGTLWGVARLSSKLSGETDENRQYRENRFGAPMIPGLKIPLTWQTPMGEINAARYISPFYANNDVTSLTKMFPFVPNIDTKKDVASNIAMNANDPLLSPIVNLAVNRDFRGKPISDPNENKYQPSTLTPQERLLNQAKFAGRAYTPPPVNSAIDVYSASQGRPNMYGAKQSTNQALARLGGIKVSQFGAEEVSKAKAKDAEYQSYKNESIDKQINSVYKQQLKGEATPEQVKNRIKNLESQKVNLNQVQTPSKSSQITTGSNIPVYRYLDNKGNMQTIDLSEPLTQPEKTGQTELDKKKVSKFKGEITSRISDVVKLNEEKQISDSEAEKLIKELKSQSDKVSIKKVKTKKPKQIKLKSVKVPKVKQIKVKQIKVPKAKVIKLGKLKKPKTIKLKTIKYKK